MKRYLLALVILGAAASFALQCTDGNEDDQLSAGGYPDESADSTRLDSAEFDTAE